MYRADIAENSRLFIISGKGIAEETYKEKFGQYGKVEDIWIVKDKRTDEEKGVVYITFSKASEALLAMEEMNGKILSGNPRPLKVVVASTKRDGSVRDPREDEKFLRLFVIIPKTYKEEDLTNEFNKYGEVHSVSVLRDKDSGAAKGFGYVRFYRAYHAALALEQCDKSFKPKFAEPKKPIGETMDRYARDNFYDGPRYDNGDRHGNRDRRAPGGYPYNERDRGQKRGFDDFFERDSRRSRRDDFMGDDGRSKYSVVSAPGIHGGVGSPFDLIQTSQGAQNGQRLHITAPLGLTQNYLFKLFNLVPGLEYCDLNEQTGIAYARYQTPQCAAYAKDKLDQFEYPIGSRVIVRFAGGAGESTMDPMGNMNDDHQVQQAAMVLERAGINPELVLSQNKGSRGDKKNEGVTYCNVTLPFPKPMGLGQTFGVWERAAMVLERAGINPELVLSQKKGSRGDKKNEGVTYCNVTLPFPKPMGPEGTCGVWERAAMVLERAGINPELVLSQNKGIRGDKNEGVTYCNVTLPFPKPMGLEETFGVCERAAMVLERAGINPELVLSQNKGRRGDKKNEGVTYCNVTLPFPKSMGLEKTFGVWERAAMVLERAGINPELVLSQNKGGRGDKKNEGVTYCNVTLPFPKPMAPEEAECAQRLFIVCQPAAVPDRILRDAFCRFGNLIDVYLLSGRNFGYAKYADAESAKACMEALHGQSMAGQRLKVMEAEPQKSGGEDSRKRMRRDDD